MAAFLYPEDQQKNYFHNWIFQCNCQLKELIVRDLHDNTWTFRHIYRGLKVILIPGEKQRKFVSQSFSPT
ncbi:hypothetical protein L1887_21019 [Cichorium endivia]|nr:hypothetical protein L1887_21019 [Cichorium endivia]